MTQLIEIAAQWGTPAYIYRVDQVRAAHAALRAMLPVPSVLYYSLKANPHPDLVAQLTRLDCLPEISSSGELDHAVAAGARAEDCLFTGPGKTSVAMEYALAMGVRRFSVESAQQLQTLDRLAASQGCEVRCLLRVRADAATAGSLRMGGQASQFGFGLAELLEGPGGLLNAGAVAVDGLHFFPVSGAADEEALLASFAQSIAAARHIEDRWGWRLAEVDLGGGFAAPYAVPGDLPTYPHLRESLEDLLDDAFSDWRWGGPRIAFESGRYLVGSCGVLISGVTDVKTREAGRVVVLDSGINHLGGLAGLGRLLPMRARPKVVSTADDSGRWADGATSPFDLVGPLCTPADVLAKGVPLPELAPGDLVLVPNVGAYGLTASLMGFLSHPQPVEVVLDGAEVVSASSLHIERRDAPLKRPVSKETS
ncbi:type III PLP-dependent enzyme domain-containing protein [Streptomyces olivaceus]|uniref:type III PLP-dependent enzyme n=1 Tax=Streptomyces olivaceus TaxID=47716 RepID=UPI0036AE4A95